MVYLVSPNCFINLTRSWQNNFFTSFSHLHEKKIQSMKVQSLFCFLIFFFTFISIYLKHFLWWCDYMCFSSLVCLIFGLLLMCFFLLPNCFFYLSEVFVQYKLLLCHYFNVVYKVLNVGIVVSSEFVV